VPSIDLSARTIGAWLRRRSENLAVLMLAVMFVAFILQIVFRYFFNLPVGWTSELSVYCWLYMVLLGSAFWLKEQDAIRFDLVQNVLGPRGRRVVGGVLALAAVVLFGMSLPATVDYVTFMKVESSSYLGIRLDILYSVYVVFVVAIIARYLWILWCRIRGIEPESPPVTDDVSSGL
jgi:TRAP-type C4-dicarboxylate transport system permease small subunit